jgi:hypothetical protein
MIITTILAIWGSLLSTVLFCFKIWEMRRDRFRLTISLGIDNRGPEINLISITNHFRNPITIDAMQLFWSTKLKDENTHDYIPTQYEDDCYISVPAYSTKPIQFSDQYYFKIRPDDGDLYIRLRVAGRNGWVTKRLYPA